MNVLKIILSQLGNSVTNIQITNPPTQTPNNIILLDGNTAITPGSICIGEYNEIIATIKNYAVPKGTLFFVSGEINSGTYRMPKLNIVETSLNTIQLYNKLNSILKSVNNPKYSENETAFDVFFRNVVSMELTSADEIKNALYETDFKSDDPFNIIVVEFTDIIASKLIMSDIKSDIAKVFPSANMTLYSNELVIMYHSPGRMIHLPKEIIDIFHEVLVKYDAYAGVSNHTANSEMIRTEYIIAKSILNIAKCMFQETKRRIFTQEEHGTFYIMDLCYRQCEQIFHHSNMLYLCHPGIAAIIRYDNEHHTNLRKVLLCYLLNDRSLTKTSQLLYMHRNTTMNKINKIVEIIDDTMDDALIRQRLLFSCLFYDYCEMYRQQQFNVYIASTDSNTSADE